NVSLDNSQSNANIEHYQQNRPPSVELQSQKAYNKSQQNQRNTQIHNSPSYRNSIGSSTHSSFDASLYQYKAPLQMNRRSTNSSAQSIEPGIGSFPKRSDRRYFNQNHRNLTEDESSSSEDESSSSEDEIFSLFGQHFNSSPFKGSSYSTTPLNIQNEKYVGPYSAIHRSLLIKSVIPNIVKTHSDWNGISTKLRQAFENFYSTYNDDVAKLATKLLLYRNYSNPSNCDIEEFITGAVWEKPLKKYIDVLDYDIFKNQQSGVKALEAFVARSLKIHVEYLIVESKGEDPNYTSIVLNRIKKLDNITINIAFLAASHFQYASQLEFEEEQERFVKQLNTNL
ncbi:2406_t:CDS:2, partial [Racocetra fulgida]